MNEEKTEIKKLVITINGREMIVPIEEAKKLHLALAELFAKEKETVWHPIFRDRYFDRWTPVWTTSSTKYENGTRVSFATAQHPDAMDTLKLSVA